MIGELVKLSYGRLSQSEKIIEKIIKTPLSVPCRYWLRRNIDQLIPELAKFEAERRALIKKYGKYDEEKKQTEVMKDTEEYTKFMEEFTELCNKEFEVTLNSIPLSEFKDVKLDSNEFDIVEFLFCEERVIIQPKTIIH